MISLFRRIYSHMWIYTKKNDVSGHLIRIFFIDTLFHFNDFFLF